MNKTTLYLPDDDRHGGDRGNPYPEVPRRRWPQPKHQATQPPGDLERRLPAGVRIGSANGTRTILTECEKGRRGSGFTRLVTVS